MDSFSRILCATDFSDHCRVAAERAVDLAGRYGAQLTLLHVIEHFPVDRSNVDIAPEDVDPEQYHEEKTRLALADLCAELGCGDAGQEVLFSMESAKQEILRYVEENAIDLVVIASHGKRGIKTVLGSTTHALTHHCGCDVLAVRARES